MFSELYRFQAVVCVFLFATEIKTGEKALVDNELIIYLHEQSRNMDNLSVIIRFSIIHALIITGNNY